MDVSSLASLKAELARKKNEAHLGKKSQGPKDPKQGSKTDLIWRKNKEKDKSTGNHSGSSSKIPQEEEVRVQAALEMKAKLYDKIKSGQVEDKLGVYLVNFKKDGSTIEDEEVMLDPLSEAIRHENIRKKWEEEERENLNKTDIHYQDVLFNEARDHGTAFYRFSKDAEERAKEMSDLRRLREETERERVEKDASKRDRNEAMKKRLKKIKDKKRQKMGLPPVESDEEPIKEEPTINVEEAIMQRLKLLREEQADEKRKKNVKEWDIGKTENMFNEKPIERRVLSQEEWVESKRAERPSEFAPFYQQQSYRKKFSRNSFNVENDEEWYDEDNYQQPKKKRKKKKKKKNRQQQFQHNKKTIQEALIESASSSSSESSPEFDLSEVPLPPDPSSLPQKAEGDYEKEPRFQSFDFTSFFSCQSSKVDVAPNITTSTDSSAEVIYPSVQDSYSNVCSAPVSRTFKPTTKTNFKFNVKLLCNNDKGPSSCAPDVSLESRQNLHKNMSLNNDKTIVNELDVVNLPSPSLRVDFKRTGVEIPPPCNMEYFSSISKVNKRSHWQGSRSLKELNESFQAGLSQREKMTISADKESEDSEEEVN